MTLRAAAYRYEFHCLSCDAFWSELEHRAASCPGCGKPASVRGVTTLYELAEVDE